LPTPNRESRATSLDEWWRSSKSFPAFAGPAGRTEDGDADQKTVDGPVCTSGLQPDSKVVPNVLVGEQASMSASVDSSAEGLGWRPDSHVRESCIAVRL
jgi:hypothetical protein